MAVYDETGDTNGNIWSGDTFNGGVGGADTRDEIYLENMDVGQTYTISVDLSSTNGTMEFSVLNPFTYEGMRIFIVDGEFIPNTITASSIGLFSVAEINGTVITFDFTPAIDVTYLFEAIAHGGNTFDYAVSFDEAVLISEGNDIITGDSEDNNISALGGDDLVDGLGGNDTLNGDAGNDTLTGGAGNDVFVAGVGEGADVITDFTSGEDVIDLSAYGFNAIEDMLISDTIDGAVIDLGDGNNVTLEGVTATSLTNDDLVLIDNVYVGSADDDHVSGKSGVDIMNGGIGDDHLNGGDGDDELIGSQGKDKLTGDGGEDTLRGGGGNDLLKGGTGDDRLFGGVGNDRLQGDEGNDTLHASNGNDRLDGGDGDDELVGGLGKDRMIGGAGSDTFVFEVGSHADIIFDFEDGIDLMDFSGHAGITDFADLQIVQDGAHVVINHGGNDEITLRNFDIADIDATDFVF